MAGAGLVALALWLAANDVARRTVRVQGLTRFMALALLTGYAWLATAGVLWVGHASVLAGPGRDAMLHALFLGFVMSMIFAHAPVIVPGVLGVAMSWRPISYTHLVLLHAGLLVRVVADLVGAAAVVRWGGLLNVAAVLLFLANTGVGVRASLGGPAVPRADAPQADAAGAAHV